MSSAETICLVLGGVCLLLGGGILVVFMTKSASEQALRTEIDRLRSQLTDAAKGVGQIEELNRSLDKVGATNRELEERLRVDRDAREKLAADLSAARAEAKIATDSAEGRVRQEQDTTHRLIEAEKASREEVLAAKDRQIADKDRELADLKEFLEKANTVLGDQFKSISHDTLKEFSAQFEKTAKQIIEQNSDDTEHKVKLHKQQIEQMLQPVGKTLDQLNAQVKETNEKRGEAEAVLFEKIKEFAGANEKLANALSKPVIRGSFAQDKLEALLEMSGLVLGENFDSQVAVQDGDQTRFIDVLIHLPQRRKLVIDSKNLLVPYVAYANATEEEKPARLAEFKRQFRSTLKNLSLKNYSKHWEGIDAVMMFLPDEGMYLAAIEEERELIASMFEHRVFTVSPISLLPILKSIAYILGLEKQNRDTTQVVEAGRAMYESLGTILGKLDTLGERMAGGVKAYNEVIASFEGNVLPKARALEQMGVKKGTPHKTVKAIDVPQREFKERVVRELSALPEIPLLDLAFVTEEPIVEEPIEEEAL